MLRNTNISGTPEEVREALDLQAKAWKEIVWFGKEKLAWIRKPENKALFAKRSVLIEKLLCATTPEDESSIVNFVYTLYSLNDAEGHIGDMIYHMVGAFVNMETKEAAASGVIYGSKKCLEFVEKARKYDKAKEVQK